ncbi:MAG TPA: hypothetical protein VHV30_14805 [Polyangiaceae bacterium]|nr:hypothetical protein [Polyangiaceae bacterium]
MTDPAAPDPSPPAQGASPAPQPAGPPDDDDDDRPSPFGWFPLVILALLVGGGLYMMFQMRSDAALQDCVQSGRKNCAPIDTTNP